MSHQTLSQCLLSLACGHVGPLVGGNTLYVVGMGTFIWGWVSVLSQPHIHSDPFILPQSDGVLTGS